MTDVYRLMVVEAAKRQTVRDRIGAIQTPDGRDWVSIASNMFRAERTDAPLNTVPLSYLVTGWLEPEIAAIFSPGDPDLMFCLDTLPVEGANAWLIAQGNYPVHIEI